MSMSKDPSRNTQQQAIDGILFGSTEAGKRKAHLSRTRFRSAARSDDIVPRRRTPIKPVAQESVQPSKPAAVSGSSIKPRKDQGLDNSLGSASMPVDFSLTLDDEPQKKVSTKQGFKFFWRHPLKAIRAWSWRRRTTWALIVLVIIGAMVSGFLFVKGYMNLHKVLKGGGSAPALQANVKPSLLKGEGDGRINILLLGVGGPNHDGPDLTDTMLVASIDPVNHKAALLSIPRDLWVTVPNHGSMKINAVYETGKYGYLGQQTASDQNTKAIDAGFAMADQTVEQVLGIPIHYHVLVNFTAFQKAVDTVGGITVDVPTELYDPTMAWENNGSPVLAYPGVQTFDGAKALMYVRSRETTSDFARTQRQRAVIVALMQKVFSAGTFSDPVKITQLMDAFGDNVVADLSISDLSHLYSLTKGIDASQIQSVGLADPPNNYVTTGYVGNQSVVLPIAGMGNYSDIQSYVRNTLRDGYLAKENATVAVLNGTPTVGLATQKAAVLKSYGYTLGTVGDAPTTNYQKTVIVDLANGKKPYTAQYLKERFGVSSTTSKLPDSTIKPQGADFVVILGQDETATSQN